MAKHTQTIRQLFSNELLECVWHLVGVALIGLKNLYCALKPFLTNVPICFSGFQCFAAVAAD